MTYNIHRYWLCLLLCLGLAPCLSAQEFREILEKPSQYSFETIKKSAVEHFDRIGTGKGSGYKQYMRWQWFMEGRLDEQGRLHNPKVRNFEEAQKFREFQTVSGKTTSSNGDWASKGPSDYSTTTEGTGPGLGRLNTLAFDPNNSSIVYVGAPDGGLWKSTNGGGSWTSIYDEMSNLGVSGIAIDPNNSQRIFVLTGDGPGVISTLWPSIHNVGVMVTTNGGTSWQSTNLTFSVPNDSRGHRLLMDPNNSNELLIATSTGIYRTANGGSTWSSPLSGNFRSMEFHPGNSNIVYASTPTDVYRSTNGGASWSLINQSVFPSGTARSLLAVSPDEPNWVYIAFAGTSGDFRGLYRSTDSGLTWSQRGGTSVDYFDLSVNGGGGTAVGHYAMAMTVHPADADRVDLAALSHWRSTDGGQSFSIQSYWDTDIAAANGLDYCHGDFHFLQYESNGALWACNDGGIWEWPVASIIRWVDRSEGLVITQNYRLAERNSQASPVYLGTQDNGMFKYSGSSTFTHAWIGDVMDMVVNQNNPNQILAERFSGQLYRSTDAGVTFNTTTETSPTGVWITPIEGDPNNGNVVYTIRNGDIVRRSTDFGQTWTSLNSGARPDVDIEVAPSSSATLYACDQTRIWKSTNTGSSWTQVNGNLTPGSGAIFSDLEIDPSNPARVWVTLQGYNSSQKVFVTTNSGTTWTSLSSGLPNVPVNAVVHSTSGPNAVYVGTDIGVWYRDDNTGAWVDFNNGLPSVVVLDLEIYQLGGGNGTLRCATFGRGYWESDLYSSSCPINLSLSGKLNNSATYEASSFITSTQKIGGSLSSVVYDAGDYIQLNPGFETQTGLGSFQTQLIGCGSSKAQPIVGVYEGPMAGVSIPYELQLSEGPELSLRLAPNPGNDLVSFIYYLPEDGVAEMAIYSTTGRVVAKVLDQSEIAAGEYRVRHDISALPNGVYFVKFKSGKQEKTERLVVLH